MMQKRNNVTTSQSSKQPTNGYSLNRAILSRAWQRCKHRLDVKCKQAAMRVVKTVRLTMAQARDVMARVPDVKIVYLLRDPRGIVYSRRRARVFARVTTAQVHGTAAAAADTKQTTDGLTTATQPGDGDALQLLEAAAAQQLSIAEAALLCERMREDLAVYSRLKAEHPDHVLQLTYENIAANSSKYYRKLYDFLGIEYSPEVEEFLSTVTHAEEDGTRWSVTRQNSTATALKWKAYLGRKATQGINKVCDSVIKRMSGAAEIDDPLHV